MLGPFCSNLRPKLNYKTKLSKQRSEPALVSTFLLNVYNMNVTVKAQKWKISYLGNWLVEISHSTPFFILAETHLENKHINTDLIINAFSIFHADRTGRNKGGTTIFSMFPLPQLPMTYSPMVIVNLYPCTKKSMT